MQTYSPWYSLLEFSQERSDIKMLEKLASLQHEIWAHWMECLFKVSIQNEDGSITIPAENVTRWKRQKNTKYTDLTAEEQKSDIEQAIKIIDLIKNQ